jgi:hypothetical protein
VEHRIQLISWHFIRAVGLLLLLSVASSIDMASRQRKQATPTPRIMTNAEGFEIPALKGRSHKLDRFSFVLMGILQIVAVGIIAKQLKALGVLPDYIDTDFMRVRPATLLLSHEMIHRRHRGLFRETCRWDEQRLVPTTSTLHSQ